MEDLSSLKKTARLAGIVYFVLAATAIYGLMYVSSTILVKGDVIATTNNILSNEFLFRSGIVTSFVGKTLMLILVLILYRLFKPVNEHLARLMVVLVIVQIPIGFILETLRLTSLMVLKGEVLKTLNLQEQQDLAWLFIKIHGYGVLVLEIFWGLWLLPFGQLVYRSGFIPRLLGVLLIVNGIGYAIESFTFLMLPKTYYLLIRQFTFVTYFGEPSIILWFLIKGVKIRESRFAPSQLN